MENDRVERLKPEVRERSLVRDISCTERARLTYS